MHEVIFPTVSGKNLDRKKLTFPRDFPAKFNLIIMAFYQRQQLDVNTWLPFVDKLDEENNEFTYFEFPVVYKMNAVRQFFLNEGMRAGILDQGAREKTVTLYLDKKSFLDQLGIDSQSEIQLFLVEEKGNVIWQEAGVYTSNKVQGLLSILESKNNPEASSMQS